MAEAAAASLSASGLCTLGGVSTAAAGAVLLWSCTLRGHSPEVGDAAQTLRRNRIDAAMAPEQGRVPGCDPQ